MHGGHTRRRTAVRQLDLVRTQDPIPLESKRPPLKLDEETERALLALMAQALVAVARCLEVDDER